MTYKEWFTLTGKRFQLSADDIDLIVANQISIIGDADGEVDIRKAKTALCKEFATMIPLCNVSEGGYSLTWNFEAVRLWYQTTCAELGLNDITTPKIRNKSDIW